MTVLLVSVGMGGENGRGESTETPFDVCLTRNGPSGPYPKEIVGKGAGEEGGGIGESIMGSVITISRPVSPLPPP